MQFRMDMLMQVKGEHGELLTLWVELPRFHLCVYGSIFGMHGVEVQRPIRPRGPLYRRRPELMDRTLSAKKSRSTLSWQIS